MIRVLFVCTGNTCRSPMSEALLKSRNIANVEVKSAGIFASEGLDASEYAREVLKDNQINYKHTSKLLSKEDVEWATCILTMTTSHKLTIQSRYPEYKDKVYTLKGFITKAGDDDVNDPFGGTKQHYQETFQELSKLLDIFIEDLR